MASPVAKDGLFTRGEGFFQGLKKWSLDKEIYQLPLTCKGKLICARLLFGRAIKGTTTFLCPYSNHHLHSTCLIKYIHFLGETVNKRPSPRRPKN